MQKNMQGSIRLFRVLGITVFLHWSWFLIALYEIQSRAGQYSSITWNVLEYLSLFMIVLLHEFGHSLACRQVGGQADQIVLWPLGGIAFVSPPQRPGATLWSIAAGPLVNVALTPVLGIILLMGSGASWAESNPNIYNFFFYVLIINVFLLAFNILPIYPLDGGQILRSLLWFKFGQIKSLKIAAIIGFFGVGGLILYALWRQSIWIGILAVFVLLNCWSALTHARSMSNLAKAPRREGFACPKCRTAPPRGAFWTCPNCKNPFDPFGSDASCPNCRAFFAIATCPECKEAAPFGAWNVAPKIDN
jgi:Zn-dependent protease